MIFQVVNAAQAPCGDSEEVRWQPPKPPHAGSRWKWTAYYFFECKPRRIRFDIHNPADGRNGTGGGE